MCRILFGDWDHRSVRNCTELIYTYLMVSDFFIWETPRAEKEKTDPSPETYDASEIAIHKKGVLNYISKLKKILNIILT